MSTLDVGAGFCPAGLSPAGFGSPATADLPGGAVFVDPATGQSLSSARIDPTKGDYVFGPNGMLLGMTRGQQFMYLAINTVKGSAADSTVGQTFSSIQDIGPNLQRSIEDAVRLATASGVAAGIVAIQSVEVDTLGTTGAFLSVNWIDLETGLEDTTRV